MRPTRLIFLDIDGVLTCDPIDSRLSNLPKLDPELVARFIEVVEQTDAKVVLSSTWRLDPRLLAALREHIDVHSVTPLTGNGRNADIRKWLDRNAHEGPFHFAILDDDPDAWIDGYTFQTDWTTGLTEEIAAALVAHFDLPPPGRRGAAARTPVATSAS